MSPIRILAVGTFAALATTASGFDRDPDKQKVYPRCESKYAKSFPKPSINCGTCFGYYQTQWRSWSEACGQPEMTYSSTPEVKPVEPKAKLPEVAPVPKADPVPLPVPVPDPKPVEPKKPAPSGKSAMLPVPAQPVSLNVQAPVPAAIEAPLIPLIPTMPDVNVK